MAHLEDVRKYCKNDIIENLYCNYTKVYGIESDLEIINENQKCVGRVLLLNGTTKKILLDSIVEFDQSKIKWKATLIDQDGKGFYIIDQYWCKSYSPKPKIKVPVKIYHEDSDSVDVEIQRMTFSQYMKRRLYEVYAKYEYRYIAAYNNYYELRVQQKPHHYCLNATVRNYYVKKAQLVRFISFMNNTKKKIKSEWNELLYESIQNEKATKLYNELANKKAIEKSSSNVIKFKK